MRQPLPAGATRVQQILEQAGASCRVQLLPESTASALDAAQAVGVPVAQIGKSIVFADSDKPVVAVVPGDRKVDTKLLAGVVHVAKLRRPKADEIFKMTGFRIGGISPFALPEDAIVIIDNRLAEFPSVYVAAGHPRAVVCITYAELVRLSVGTEASISA